MEPLKLNRRDPAAAQSSRTAPDAAPAIASANSEALLGSAGELKILHNGEQYNLRRTRNGKLILTK